jgi:hypothetical protein
MSNKLVIIVASPLTKNIYERIGADQFEGLEVQVLDCLLWMKCAIADEAYVRHDAGNVTRIASLAEFQAAMAHQRPDFLLDFVGRGPFTKMVQEICRACSTRYIAHHLVPFPSVISRHTALRTLRHHPLTTAQRACGVIRRWLKRENPYPPDIALLAGAKSITPWLASARTIIHTATPNYFALTAPAEQASDYLLFIDDCLPLSFDFQLGGFQAIMTPENYFPMLNQFFDRLEMLMGLPVVVAAHPNGEEYPHYADWFGGRRVVFGQTALLSQRCAVALTHYSSAISYPVLLQKPLHTLNFLALRQSQNGASVEYIASLLNRAAIDIDAQLDDAALLDMLREPVDLAYYTRYTKDYIIDTPSPGANPFDNLRRYLLTS